MKLSEKIIEQAKKKIKKHPELRLGQSVMNLLFFEREHIYNLITGTDIDCFYDDTKIDECLEMIDKLDI